MEFTIIFAYFIIREDSYFSAGLFIPLTYLFLSKPAAQTTLVQLQNYADQAVQFRH